MRKSALAALLASTVLVTFALSAAAQQDSLNARVEAMLRLSTEMTRTLDRIRDASSAKAAVPELEKTNARYLAAQAALEAELKKLPPGDPKLKEAQAAQQKAAKSVGEQQKRVLANKEAGAIVAKALEPPTKGGPGPSKR